MDATPSVLAQTSTPFTESPRTAARRSKMFNLETHRRRWHVAVHPLMMRLLPMAALLVAGFAADRAHAQAGMQPHFTRHPGVAQGPPSSNWETTPDDTYTIYGGETVWISFENEGYDDRAEKDVTLTITCEEDQSIAQMTPFQQRAGFREGPEGPNNPPVRGSRYPPSSSNSTKYVLSFSYPDCMAWERFKFTHRGNVEESTTFHAHLTSSCWSKSDSAPGDGDGFGIDDARFGTPDGQNDEMRITEMQIFPELVPLDLTSPVQFNAPPESGPWQVEPVFMDPDGNPRPDGGWRVWSDGQGLFAGDPYSLHLEMIDDAARLYEMFLLDANVGDWAGLFYYNERFPWIDSLEGYEPGEDVADRGLWAPFDDDPAFSAPLTETQSRSAPFAIDVVGDASIVREFDDADTGQWSFTAWQYIPTDFASGGGGELDGTYLTILNTYDSGGPYDYSVLMQFDSNDGLCKVFHGDGFNTIDVPYDTDRWVKIQTIVDLENDWTQIYYDDNLITEYTWTGGILGEGGGALDIASVNLQANGSTSVYYDDLSLEQCSSPEETFEHYAVGQGIHGQGGWKGWQNNPIFDGIITEEQSHSPTKSLDVADNTDLVHEYCTAGVGVWEYTAWQYIPSDFVTGGQGEFDGSYFLMFSDYVDGGPYNWTVQIQFDSRDGMLKALHGDGTNSIDVPYIVDQWVPIEIVIDLDNDHTQVYYDDALVTEYQWTAGRYGDGDGTLDIAAVDLFAQGSSSIFYDDLVLVPLSGCPEDLDGSGDVGFGDILEILAAWGDKGGPEDLDGSGTVDFGDILVVLANWGSCD